MNSIPEELLDKIIVEDCIIGIRKLPADSIDLIISDPPYNLNKDFGIWKETEKKTHLA